MVLNTPANRPGNIVRAEHFWPRLPFGATRELARRSMGEGHEHCVERGER
jgi:hypothetical protein